jgi:hypothetical protein
MPARVPSGYEARCGPGAAGSGGLARGGVYQSQPAFGAPSAVDGAGERYPGKRSTGKYSSSRRGHLERVCRAAAGWPAARLGAGRLLPARSAHAACDRRGKQHRGDLVGHPGRTALAFAAGHGQQDPLGIQDSARRMESAGHQGHARRQHADGDHVRAGRPRTVDHQPAGARLLDIPPELVRPHRRTQTALRGLTVVVVPKH